MNQNDMFVTAMVEYTVAETTTGNGWTTLLSCVLSEFPHDKTREEVSSFLIAQEKLFKEGGNTLPAAYRSAKATLLKAIEFQIPFTATIGKSDLYEQTKAAAEKKREEDTDSTIFDGALAAARKHLHRARATIENDSERKRLKEFVEEFLRALDD